MAGASSPFRGLVPLPLIAIVAACASSTPPPATPPPAPLPAPAPAVIEAPAPSPPATCSLAAQSAAAIPDAVRDLQHSILSAHGAADAVESLTTEVGSRLAGSPGDKLAVAWALKTMRERGLSSVHAEPVKVPVWQRGVETASLVSPIPHALAVTALGWSGATPPKGVEGDLVRFDSLDALKEAAPKSLTGKIAFLDVRMVGTQRGLATGRPSSIARSARPKPRRRGPWPSSFARSAATTPASPTPARCT